LTKGALTFGERLDLQHSGQFRD